jgi:hypothetical protein
LHPAIVENEYSGIFIRHGDNPISLFTKSYSNNHFLPMNNIFNILIILSLGSTAASSQGCIC